MHKDFNPKPIPTEVLPSVTLYHLNLPKQHQRLAAKCTNATLCGGHSHLNHYRGGNDAMHLPGLLAGLSDRPREGLGRMGKGCLPSDQEPAAL